MQRQQVYLVRHGQTDWSLSGKHTGRTDIPLTAAGMQRAQKIGQRLQGLTFPEVWTSPSLRARTTSELAGHPDARVDQDLAEWDYGHYEGKTSTEIHAATPNWDLWRDGAPGGESVTQISDRADRVTKRLREVTGDVLIFSSGHFLRVLASRWVGLHASSGRTLMLETGSLSILSYEHDFRDPVIKLWNDTAACG